MKSIIIFAILLTMVLCGCGTTRPTNPPEMLSCNLAKFTVADIYSDRNVYLRNTLQINDIGGKSLSFNVLSLSAGGEFGAYGAGFLVGWGKAGDSAQPGPRSDIQVVTGVSTGAILATYAFLGRDPEIEKVYLNLTGSQVYKARSRLGYIWANSYFDTTQKDQLISDHLPSQIIDDVANQYGKGHFLYIGMVNLDTGEFVRINMVNLAHDIQPKELRDQCYRAVIGASSAIPIAFSPKFIDDHMWVDGGARRHLFITQPPKDAMGANVTRKLYSFVHGNLTADTETVTNGVLQIALRTATLATDQGLKDSIRLQEDLASKCPEGMSCGQSDRLFETYYASAAKAAEYCRPESKKCIDSSGISSADMFCNPYMVCLANQGETDGLNMAKGAQPWLSINDLCLGSNPKPDCNKSYVTKRKLFQ